MERRNLGTSGLEVSAIRLGCMGMNHHRSATVGRDESRPVHERMRRAGHRLFAKRQSEKPSGPNSRGPSPTTRPGRPRRWPSLSNASTRTSVLVGCPSGMPSSVGDTRCHARPESLSQQCLEADDRVRG